MMSFKLSTGVALLVAMSSGCNLVSSTGLQTDYSFDAIQYASPTFGSTTPEMVPDVPCDTTADPCAMSAAALGASEVTFSCDGTIGKCIGAATIRVSQTIDLSKQLETSFPSQAVQFGINQVDVERITYWVNTNALNVATPMIDFYVASSAAMDETDPSAVLLTSVAPVPAGSVACADPVYAAGDKDAMPGIPVCSAPLPSTGKAALSNFVKSYKTPFQIIAHTVITAMPGDPVPSGSISFAARPTVGLKILD